MNKLINAAFLAVFAAVFVLPSASATCLTANESATVYAVSDSLNLSSSQAVAFYTLFEDMCSRVASTAQIRNETQLYVQGYLANYTAAFEEQADIVAALKAIKELIDASSNITHINETIGARLVLFEDQYDARFTDLENEIHDFIGADDFEQWKALIIGNMTIELERKLQAYQQPYQQQQEPPYALYIAVVAVLAIVGLYAWRRMHAEKVIKQIIRRDDAAYGDRSDIQQMSRVQQDMMKSSAELAKAKVEAMHAKLDGQKRALDESLQEKQQQGRMRNARKKA